MRAFLKRLVGSRPNSADEDRHLLEQSGAQSLRIELAARDEAITRLKADLERERATTQTQAKEKTDARLHQLMRSAATPAAQLALQAHLLESEGKLVEARDVLAVARALVRTLEKEGLLQEDKPGQRVAFDPDRHEPLSAQARVKQGQPVVVKLPGIAFRGLLLRKAGVVPALD